MVNFLAPEGTNVALNITSPYSAPNGAAVDVELNPSSLTTIATPVVVNDSGVMAPTNAYKPEIPVTAVKGWSGSQFGTQYVQAGNPTGVNGPYAVSWNALLAGVMRDSSASYINGTYVKSWLPGTLSDLSIAGLDTVKFVRAIRTKTENGAAGWVVICPTANTFAASSTGMRYTRNSGTDWTGASGYYLDQTDNALFSKTGNASTFSDLCPSAGDAVWLAIKPTVKTTSTTVAPQMCVIAYSQDVPMYHNSALSDAIVSTNKMQLNTSTTTPDAEFNSRSLSVDFSLSMKSDGTFKCNNAFAVMVSYAALKLRVDNHARQWIDASTGLTLDFYAGNMPADTENPVEGTHIGTVSGVTTSAFSTPDRYGSFYMTTVKELTIDGTGTISYVRITGKSSDGTKPTLWVPVNQLTNVASVMLTRTTVNALDYRVRISELAFKFQVAA